MTGDISFEVNYTCIVEEIGSAEPHNFLLDGTNINNDVLNYEDEAEWEEIGEESMSCEVAPAPEVINMEQVISRIVDALISCRQSTTLSNNALIFLMCL